jgi:2'-5' RNA ligase
MIRLFVAIDLPDTQRQTLAALTGGVPGAKWLGPDQMHLTLRFIGEVDDVMLADIAVALSRVETPAFDMTVAGVGYWGDKRRAKVLWAGIRANPVLLRLQTKIENALVRIGLEPSPRKYYPHITLARLHLESRHRVADFLGRNGGLALAPLRVEQFVLYSSFLSASGAIHTPETLFPLRVTEPSEQSIAGRAVA